MRLGKSSCASIGGPISREVELLQLVANDDRALRVADRDVLEVPLAPGGTQPPGAIRTARGKVLGSGRGAPHLDRAGPLRGDRRRDRPSSSVDREGVLVGPAVAAQVEDRLSCPVARQLCLRAIRVEDPQLGDEVGIVAAREQQHPVGADAEVRIAEPLHPRRRQLPGERLRLDDQVVVAQRLPLLESARRQPRRSTTSQRVTKTASAGVVILNLASRTAVLPQSPLDPVVLLSCWPTISSFAGLPPLNFART